MCVKSILDTDLYKFTTSYAYMKLFPDAEEDEKEIDELYREEITNLINKFING